jgi:tRNA pseudouridine55 synthase
MLEMDGVLILDKPRGITSARALYRCRGILGQRKSGHAGTLDPAAEGVLVICLGRATKLVEAMMDLPKVYRATARLDVTSTSFDSDRPLTGKTGHAGTAICSDLLAAPAPLCLAGNRF